MIVTFPHFGEAYLGLRLLFKKLGIEYRISNLNDDKLLQKGIELSPEEMCLPFKYMIGNLIDAYEKGADTVIMVATGGPCRLGEYGELLKCILCENGYDYRWIILESPSIAGWKSFFKKLRYLTDSNIFKISVYIVRTAVFFFKMEKLKGLIMKRAATFEDTREGVRMLRDWERAVGKSKSFTKAGTVTRKMIRKAKNIKQKEYYNYPKVLLVGEIFTSVDRNANMNIEYELINLGCQVYRHITIWWWIKHTVYECVTGKIPFNIHRRKGIPCDVGGYARDTVRKVLSSRKYDGIIKIMPSGCMPEIVAKSFCETIQEKNILHLVYDELGEKVGYTTRVEAFVDMLGRKKNVLDGDRHWIHKHRFCGNR